MKGKFITFEGSEGCGKSTQSRMLYDYLKKKKKKVIYLREPGATKVSEKIRDILLDAKNDAMLPECEMFLYMAARSQIVAEVIKPQLKKGAIVICDRFLDSTLAYQGYGLGIDIDFIKCVGKFATFGINPGLTIFLDLPVNKGLVHRDGRRDRIEKRPFSYHLRVRKGYLDLAKKDPGRIKVVRVEKDKYSTQNKIRKLVEKYAF
jgi:dTMP kinase